MSSSVDFIFERAERCAVVAHRKRDGDFSYDGYCGQTPGSAGSGSASSPG